MAPPMALILDIHLVPKIMPQFIKSIEFVEGDGGVCSIKKTTLAEGTSFKYLKHRIDALDADNCMCNYTLIEGDVLGDKLESISYEFKFESAGGGSVCKITSHYQTKGDYNVKEEDIKEAKDKHMEVYKIVEDRIPLGQS
ncbi:major strawberry allergen Fra a 1-3-like [Quercus robur]|uniref:major strawberry allergen Fra a 1-3-like n=1 Tax=Quercus robur TaxID=38942 RepID=UPI0021612C8B|nr:major strawberry allergen Fra a 1-3-like [Quercus robur]